MKTAVVFFAAVLAQTTQFPIVPPFEADTGGDTETDDVIDPVVPELDPEALEAAMAKLAMEKNAAGLELIKQQKYPAALAHFRAAYELMPDDPEIVNNYGYAHSLLGSVDDAEKHYREAIALDPERAVAYINLSDLLLKKAPDDRLTMKRAAGTPLPETSPMLKHRRRSSSRKKS